MHIVWYYVTVSLCNLEEAIACVSDNLFPRYGGKPLYIGNQEMSDKSRNRL